MDKNMRHDLKIAGVWNTQGGIFNNVIVNGVSKIYSDIDCINFDINGVCDVDGSVKSNIVKINGKVDIKGSLISEDLKNLEHTGVGGNTSGSVEIKGLVEIKDNCNTETFVSNGSFMIGGLLNAENIDVVLHAPCKAKEIGGDTIRVKKGSSFKLKKIIRSIFPSLEVIDGLLAESIEGDDISLEYTRAKVVRGDNVKIGSGCEIELVEYRNNFDADKGAKVKESRKI